MTRIIVLSLAAAAALAGCNKENHTIVAGGDPADNAAPVAANKPIALPPSIVATKAYRCADNTIVHVNWLSDDKSATIRVEQAGAPTKVEAAEAGHTMTAPGGYSLSGSHEASSAKIGIPGHAPQSCKA